MKDRFIIAKAIAGEIIYFIWHRGTPKNAMEVTNRVEAMNLTSRDSVLCAESNLFSGRDIPVRS